MDKLLSGFPTLKDLHDPEGYIANLITIVTEFCLADAQAGTVACANNCDFPPTRFQFRNFLDTAAYNRLKLERLRSIPTPQPVPRVKGPKVADPPPGPDGKHPEGTILSDYQEAVKTYGRPVGRFEDGRKKT